MTAGRPVWFNQANALTGGPNGDGTASDRRPRFPVCNFTPPPGGGYVCARCGKEWLEHAYAAPCTHSNMNGIDTYFGPGKIMVCDFCGERVAVDW